MFYLWENSITDFLKFHFLALTSNLLDIKRRKAGKFFLTFLDYLCGAEKELAMVRSFH